VDNFIDATEPGACFICGAPAFTVEINFEAYLHRECEDIADDRFWAAVAERE
jgi:hypothetical protein